MITLYISDTTITGADIEKTLLGGYLIKTTFTVPLTEGKDWIEKISSIVRDKDVTLVIPDTRTYYHRFTVPEDASADVLQTVVMNKAKEIIPEKSTNLVYDYTTIHKSTVLFVAVEIAYIKPLITALKQKKITPSFATSEPLARFHVLSSIIKKDETVGYLDIGASQSIFTLYDRDGPLFSFTEPLQTSELKEGLSKSLRYFEEKYVQQVSRIIVGGEKSLDLDYAAFEDVFQERELLHMDKIIQNLTTKNHIENKSAASLRTLSPVCIGGGLLYYEKERITLLNKHSIEAIEEFQLKAGDAEPETVHSFLERSRVPTITLEEAHPEEARKKKRRSRLVILLLVLGILVVSLIGLLYYKNIQTQQADTTIPSPAASEEVTDDPPETPTPSPEPERSSLSIRVLNGTGEAGVASTAQEILEERGYETIETGNAESFDFTQTVVQVKEDRQEYLQLLLTDLQDTYTVASDEAPLNEDETVDAIIIIGTDQAEEENT